MKIVIASDHAGFALKEKVKLYLAKNSHQVIDVGTYSESSTDYPIFGIKAGETLINDKLDLGIIICGSGVGISIAAQKVKGVRCALIYNKKIAELAKKHNNANMLSFGARFFSFKKVSKMIDIFLNTEFEARHQKRINLIDEYEGESNE